MDFDKYFVSRCFVVGMVENGGLLQFSQVKNAIN